MKKESICWLAHGDLDGLYSSLLYYHFLNKPKIDYFMSVEYGQDYSYLKFRFDNFLIFDFAENIGGDKTLLHVDHHLRVNSVKAQKEIIYNSLSCVSLMRDKVAWPVDALSDEDVSCIDAIDSGNYKWSSDFTKEDLLLPEPNNRLSKFIILNQLLRKNRKRELAEVLFQTRSLDVDENLSLIEEQNSITKYKTYTENKQKLIEKIMKDPDKYIKRFSEIPVLFTKEFTQEDWKGYDLNILGYLASKSPFIIIVFDMADVINTQIVRNAFYSGEPKKTVLSILENSIGEPRGHENILNFTFTDGLEASTKLDAIISKLSAEL